MALNFNVDPYYDDFDATKNFHRILFKPGFAVQARELTQAQTILQDQITKFADNIFKQNSPVTGGQITTNLNCHYIKLQNNNSLGNPIDVLNFSDKLIQNSTGTVIAKVIAVESSTLTSSGTGDPATLIVSYKTGGKFSDGETVYDSITPTNTALVALNGATGSSSVASIAQGVFYISGNYDRGDGIIVNNGTFVQVNPQTTVLSKYDNVPNVRVGLNISETIYDYINDSSLLDPAIGASNYQAPGADRYVIKLTLETRPLELGDDDNFIQLLRVEDGNVYKMVDGSVYNVIDDYFAKRDYETNGDYIVNDFNLTPKANTSDTSKYIMGVSRGLAYVHGYRIENSSPIELNSNRARTTDSRTIPVYIDNGSYFYVNNVRGANNRSFFNAGGSTFLAAQPIDVHCVSTANVNVSTVNTYSSTVVASGYLRNILYSYNTSDVLSNTSVYKFYTNDLQNNQLSNTAVGGTISSITFPSSFSSANSAYVGVSISILSGSSAGDFRTITSYDGITKVANVNSNWTGAADSTSKFSLNFDLKNSKSIFYANKTASPVAYYGTATIDTVLNKNAAGDIALQNPSDPEMIFTIGNPYVSSLSGSSYTTTLVSTLNFDPAAGPSSLSYSSYNGTIVPLAIGALNAETIKQNYTIIVTDSKTNTKINVGDLLIWTAAANASRSVTATSSGVTFTTSASDLTSFTAVIIHKAFVSVANDTSYGKPLKEKTLRNANTTVVKVVNASPAIQVGTSNTWIDALPNLNNTGQIFIGKSGLVSPGNKQSLYVCDVKSIVKILDTGSSAITPTVGAAIPNYSNITSNYIFDNGQRDSFYDHASITLRPGAPQPAGNLLILLNYYTTVGAGYSSVNSYVGENYTQIPNYQAKDGIIYSLRDCIDFRPMRENGTINFIFPSFGGAANTLLPVDLTNFTTNYSYYLGRKDLLTLSKDRSLQIVEGTPSLQPILPSAPEGSLVIANLIHKPYTGFLPTEAPNGFIGDLSIDKVKHKRYTMQDIAGLENRINHVEYYAALNSLEQNAQSLQTPDTYGLNRFKNGILVDDFSSFATADTFNNDFAATINKRTRQMTASQIVNNYPLKPYVLTYSLGKLDITSKSSLGYALNQDGLTNYTTLPYSTSLLSNQKLASRVINLNPFSVPNAEGTTALSPNMDNWVDTSYAPSLLITDPNLQVFSYTGVNNVLSNGDWKTVSGTTSSVTSSSKSTSVGNPVEGHNVNWSPFGYVGYIPTTTTITSTTTSTTTSVQNQNNIIGPYSAIGNTYGLNNGYITDISILPWIRKQPITFTCKGLLFNTGVNAFFDGKNVSNYIRKPNIIELTGVTGTFNDGDIIGYLTGATFTPTGFVTGSYAYPGTTKVRLYINGDPYSSQYYTNNGVIDNGFYNSSGTYINTSASGTANSTSHFAAAVRNVSSNTITLSALAPTTTNYYGTTGSNTLYIVAGTGAGLSATITGYNGTTKVLSLSSALACANGDLYSISETSSSVLTTNENGFVGGVFHIPENTFHNGERVFRVDNSLPVGDFTTATTFTESTFYASGLSTKAQQIDFGASPAGAKGTFTSTASRSTVSSSTQTSKSSVTTYSRWDPVAQSFIIDNNNYPNGAFLSDVSFFFKSKPAAAGADRAPVILSILATQNGYPSGETLDHSVVVVPWENIKTSDAPHYLDTTTSTEFTFPVPIYIQPNVLYAFMLKSSSDQYNLYVAASGDTAIESSVRNLPTDPKVTVVTKISSAPYVGGLFISQNSQTWTADQNQALMFTLNRCEFTKTPTTVRYIIPKGLPQRSVVSQVIDNFNGNTLFNSVESVSTSNVLVDAFNITTTEFVPTTTKTEYTYESMTKGGTLLSPVSFTPGKYATATYDDIYLSDGLGERILIANSLTSLSVYATLSSGDSAVSPLISDGGLSAYAIKWNINNCELTNSSITLANTGSGYSSSVNTIVTLIGGGASGANVSNPAILAANVVGGVIQSIYVTNGGSGYITTPTLTIGFANNTPTPSSNATAYITGETSKNGGPATAKYVTKKVSLDTGFDSGDLNVFMTAYKPVNTDILVYYKILNRNDTQSFDDSTWQLMTCTRSGSSVYSKTRNDLYEYTFAPGSAGLEQGYVQYTSTNGQTYYEFSQFAIKVVLTSSDATYTPFLNDLRCLALPSTINKSAGNQ